MADGAGPAKETSGVGDEGGPEAGRQQVPTAPVGGSSGAVLDGEHWRGLRGDLRGLALLAGGRWGIVFRDLGSGTGVELSPDETFPGASIAKVPLLIEAMRQVAAGDLRLDEELAVDVQDDENARLGSGILVHLHRGLRVTIGDLCELAIHLSDNVASNLLIERLGLPAVNRTLAALGAQTTRLNHPFADFVALRSPGSNPVTAGELARMFEQLHQRALPGSEQALGYLRRCSSNTRLPLYLPEGVRTSHKTGTLRGIVHDGGIVEGPHGAYVLVCLSGDGEDNTVAAQAIAQMSRAAWRAHQQAFGQASAP